jgi:transcriptional regulator with XRE-family HTH domain
MTGQEIKTLRVDLGRTQEAFGKLVGVTAVTVSRWENGQVKPLPGAMERIEKLQKYLEGQK